MNRRQFLASVAAVPIALRSSRALVAPTVVPAWDVYDVLTVPDASGHIPLIYAGRSSLLGTQAGERYRFSWRNDPAEKVLCEGTVISRAITFGLLGGHEVIVKVRRDDDVVAEMHETLGSSAFAVEAATHFVPIYGMVSDSGWHNEDRAVVPVGS